MSAVTTGSHGGVPTSSRALLVNPHERREGFWANIRGQTIDLADPGSGHALAPTPDDLFVVSIASDLAWSARSLLRDSRLPDSVNVAARWRTYEGLQGPADVNLTVTVSRLAESVGAALGAALEKGLAARSLAAPVVRISLEGQSD